MKSLWLTLILVVAVGNTLKGQILRVDKNHLSSDSAGYTIGSTELSFTANNRNSKIDEEILFVGIKAGFDLVRIGDQSATIWIGTINYTKLGDGPFISNGSGHLRQIFDRNVRVSPEAFLQIQYDRSRKMQTRQLLGVGARWSILQKKNSLHFGSGMMYEAEEWGLSENLIHKEILKSSTYLGGEVWLSKGLLLNTVFYLQTGLDTQSDVIRSRANGFLEIKNQLTEKLEAKISAEFAWDHRPIIPLNRLVYEMYFGLEYDF